MPLVSFLLHEGRSAKGFLLCRAVSLFNFCICCNSYLYFSIELEYFVHRHAVAWKLQPHFFPTIPTELLKRIFFFLFCEKINEVKLIHMLERCPVRNALPWIINDFEHDICKRHNFGSHFASEALIMCSIRWEWDFTWVIGCITFSSPWS